MFIYVAYCPKCGVSRLSAARGTEHEMDYGSVSRLLARLTQREPHHFAFSAKYVLHCSTEYAAHKVERRARTALFSYKARYGTGWYNGCSWEEVVQAVKQAADLPAKISVLVPPPVPLSIVGRSH